MTELEKATWEFLFDTPSVSLLKHGSPYSDFVEAITSDREKAFKAGANWQYEQFEKNRLAACDNMTKEEADREQEFTTEFIEKNHCVPTYSDAIEYGRRLMIEKAYEWLKNNLSQEVSVISGGYVHINFENSIKEFRKAMEK